MLRIYYNQRYISTPAFCHGDKMFLDSLDIYIICSSAKLSHYYHTVILNPI